jgi:hypothetical protein
MALCLIKRGIGETQRQLYLYLITDKPAWKDYESSPRIETTALREYQN